MRGNSFYIILFLAFVISCKRSEIFVEEHAGVKLLFHPEKRMFPFDWYYDDVDAMTSKLNTSQISRSSKIINKSLSKYPEEVLNNNLKKVYVLGTLNFYGVDYAGTYSDNFLYLANKGVEYGYTDRFLEQSFHHEFSSVLYWQYYSFFNEEAWKLVNPKSDSIYFDDLGGAGAMISGQDSDSFDEKYHEIGFLYQYATSSFENDINSFAENMFKCEPEFWDAIDSYYKLRVKFDIMIDFYNGIDSTFTEGYFRDISLN